MSNNTPHAGSLNDRLELQSFSATRNSLGEVDNFDEGNWSTYATVWGDVQPASGTEGTEGDQVSPEVTHTAKIRHRKGVIPTHRVLYRKEHTTLDGALNSTNGTAVTVVDAIAMPARNNFMIKVDSELMEITAGHGTVDLTATRGVNNTTPATHADAADVFFMGALNIEAVTQPGNSRESLMVLCKEAL